MAEKFLKNKTTFITKIFNIDLKQVVESYTYQQFSVNSVMRNQRCPISLSYLKYGLTDVCYAYPGLIGSETKGVLSRQHEFEIATCHIAHKIKGV